MIPVILERLNAAPSRGVGNYGNLQEVLKATLKDHGLNYESLNAQVAMQFAMVANASVLVNLLPAENALQLRALLSECWTNYCAMILPSKVGVTLVKKLGVGDVF